MSDTWEGLNVDIWGPVQTLMPQALKNSSIAVYSGYDELGYFTGPGFANIPLEIRYSNFCKRLDSMLSKTP